MTHAVHHAPRRSRRRSGVCRSCRGAERHRRHPGGRRSDADDPAGRHAAYIRAQCSTPRAAIVRTWRNTPRVHTEPTPNRRCGTLARPRGDVTPPPLDKSNLRPASVEAAIGLTRAQRVTPAKAIDRVGLFHRRRRRLWGANTRTAIARWQTANRLTASGYVEPAGGPPDQQSRPPPPALPPAQQRAGDDALEERLRWALRPARNVGGSAATADPTGLQHRRSRLTAVSCRNTRRSPFRVGSGTRGSARPSSHHQPTELRRAGAGHDRLTEAVGGSSRLERSPTCGR